MADNEWEWKTAGWRKDPREEIASVRKALKDVEDFKAPDLAERWLSFNNAVADLEALAPAEAQGTISDFFLSVGRGVVEAQQALDRESADYLRTKPAMPALYRVPKASAEINFSITSTQKRSLNVLVYGTSQKNERRNEQKVSFDVVAVPPPPDLFARLGPFLTGSAIRAGLKQRLERHLESLKAVQAPDPLNQRKRLPVLISNFDNTLIFSAHDPGDPGFSPDNLVDLPSLAAQLKAKARPVDRWLAGELGSGTELSKDVLVEKLNELLRGALLYEKKRFDGITLRPETTALVEQNPPGGTELARLNRLLLEDAYPMRLSREWELPPADVWVLVYPGTDEETPNRDDYYLEVVALSVVPPAAPKTDDIRTERTGWSRVNYLALLLHGLAEEQRLVLNRPPAGA